MNRDEYDRMFRMEESHWWFLARRDLVVMALDRFLSPNAPDPDAVRVLDVGCGTGGTLTRLSAFGDVCGLDVEPLALAGCHARGQRRVTLGLAEALPFADATFDAVIAMDVLEHVGEDSIAVREMARVLRAGGVLLASVPAIAALWSPHDEALMHRRRYSAGPFRSLLRSVPGLDLVYSTHIVTALLPIAYVVRRAQRRRQRPGETPRADVGQPAAPLNGLLYRWHRAEGALALRVPLPFGLSLFAVARKQAGVAPGRRLAAPAEKGE